MYHKVNNPTPILFRDFGSGMRAVRFGRLVLRKLRFIYISKMYDYSQTVHAECALVRKNGFPAINVYAVTNVL